MELFYWKKFQNRKLLTAGTFIIDQSLGHYGLQFFVSYLAKVNIDIIPLWK